MNIIYMMTMGSNDTLVDTPFKLISGFFHVNEVFSVVQGCVGGGGGATGLLNKGGGSNRLPGLVNNKLWNFHRYRLVCINISTYLVVKMQFISQMVLKCGRIL